MSRQLLGSFAAGLSDRELGNALLGAFLEVSKVEQPDARGRIAIRKWPLPIQRPQRLAPAAQAIARWLAFAGAAAPPPGGAGFAIELLESRSLDDDQVERAALTALLAAADHVAAVHFATANAQAPAGWLWPLDIAGFDDPASVALRGELANLPSRRYAMPVLAAHATGPIELLVEPGPLPAAVHRLSTLAGVPPVQAVLVLGGTGGVPDPLGVAAFLRERTPSAIACVADVPAAQHAAWFEHLLQALAGDADLDVALAAACRACGVGPPLVAAREQAFRHANFSTWARTVSVRAGRLPGSSGGAGGGAGYRPAPSVEPQAPSRAGPPVTQAEVEQVLAYARRGGATRGGPPPPPAATAAMGEATKRMQPVPDAHSERYVQARLFALRGDAAAPVVQSPLVPGDHRLDVWIGPIVADALVAPARFPDELLPPDRAHALTIAVIAPGITAQPLLAELVLPAQGTSAEVSFALAIPAGLARLEARVTVLHGNRILQTLLLVADVGAGAPRPLQLALEAVVRRDLGAIGDRRPFDVALLSNQLAGQRSVSVFAGPRAHLVAADAGIAQMTAEIGQMLEEVTNAANPKKYGKPSAKGTVELLGALARKGVLLRDALLSMPLVRDELATAKRIQIIAAKLDESTLPIELCYDGAAPALDAKMCPQWEAALTAGACQPACPADRSTVICPVAFWGMTRCIERHAFAKPDAAQVLPNAYALQTEPAAGRTRLPLSKTTVCAAAAAARAVEPEAVDEAFARATSLGKRGREVKAWAGWKKQIEDNPTLLVLLPHTDESNGTRTLVIGEDTASIASIDPSYVGTGAGSGPIVLLLGCSTAVTELAYQSFVVRFRRGGAAVVIGTLCEILGRHAGPITTEVVAELATAAAVRDEGTPIGDLFPRVRRRLLARGFPIVLAITSYGDADWLI